MTEYMKKSITAIVLAGGQSSRMGRDKALLSFGERTLLSQICHVARECATQVYIVTPWIEKYQHIVPQNCQLIREKLLSPNKQSVLHHHGMVEVDGETGRGIQAGAETSRDSTDGPNVVGNRPHRVLPLRWGDGEMGRMLFIQIGNLSRYATPKHLIVP